MESKNENQEFDEAEKDPDVYFDPHRVIPIELWHEILQYNSFQDLLNLSLVCKTFYGTIKNLPEAIDKIALKLNKTTLQDEELILSSSRIFRNIKFQGTAKFEDCKKIITKFEGNIRTLEFKEYRMTEEEFIDILEKTQKNLKALSFLLSLIIKNSLYPLKTTRTFKLAKLLKLEIRLYNVNDSILKLLDVLPDTLLEVIYEFPNKNLESTFLKFLERQKYLKHLSLIELQNTEYLNTIDDARIKFKLEKLEIDISEDDVEFGSFVNLDKFLRIHAESLKELRLSNVSLNAVKESFKNMPNLRAFKINFYLENRREQFENGPSFNCPSLKSLIIEHHGHGNLSYLNFFKRFPNVQEIDLRMDSKTRTIKMIAKNYPNLKSLTLEKFTGCCFETVSFKNLTTFEISKYGNEEIDLESLIFAMENLGTLKLSSKLKITGRSLLFILVNFKKLARLEINNGSKLSDGLLCRHLDFFKNLRFLNIFGLPGPVENFIAGLSQFPYLIHSLSIKPLSCNK